MEMRRASSFLPRVAVSDHYFACREDGVVRCRRPSPFLCPLTGHRPEDPVLAMGGGHLFERHLVQVVDRPTPAQRQWYVSESQVVSLKVPSTPLEEFSLGSCLLFILFSLSRFCDDPHPRVLHSIFIFLSNFFVAWFTPETITELSPQKVN